MVATQPLALPLALTLLRAVAIGSATSTVSVPGGVAVLNSNYPAAHSLNRLLIDTEVHPSELVAAAEASLGEAGLDHRSIEVFDVDLGHRLAKALQSDGYESSDQLVMAATGPSQKTVTSVPVVELELAERADVATAEWRRDKPEWEEAVCRQLGDRIAAVQAAVDATFFAVRADSSAVIAHADLYLHEDVAQIEEVMTAPGHRGRGLASAAVLHAVQRARDAGATLIFLIADADDWPQHLYRRLGFTQIATTVTLSKTIAADPGR